MRFWNRKWKNRFLDEKLFRWSSYTSHENYHPQTNFQFMIYIAISCFWIVKITKSIFEWEVFPEKFWKISQELHDPQLVYSFIYCFCVKMARSNAYCFLSLLYAFWDRKMTKIIFFGREVLPVEFLHIAWELPLTHKIFQFTICSSIMIFGF